MSTGTLAISGGTIVTGASAFAGDIVVHDTTIGALIPASGSTVDTAVADCAEQLDASGCSVLSGFVDLQVNGAVGVDLTNEPDRIGEVAAFLPTCGVTSFLPTIITGSHEHTEHALDVLQAHRAGDGTRSSARVIGAHLEGPFLNPDRAGAHPRQHLREPSCDEAAGWSAARGVALVTLAPERPGALDVVRLLRSAGVVVAAGHTAFGPAAMDAMVAAGVGAATHLFNAMGTMSARDPGPAGAVLTDARLVAGLILDGLHVDATMVRLAWQSLGPDRIVVVTDAMAALGLPDGEYAIGETAVVVGPRGARTRDDVLAGSVLPFDAAARNLVAFTGCTIGEMTRATSANAARLLGRDDIGRIAPLAAADLVLLDEQLQVVATVVGGRVVFDPQQRCSPSRPLIRQVTRPLTRRSSWKS